MNTQTEHIILFAKVGVFNLHDRPARPRPPEERVDSLAILLHVLETAHLRQGTDGRRLQQQSCPDGAKRIGPFNNSNRVTLTTKQSCSGEPCSACSDDGDALFFHAALTAWVSGHNREISTLEQVARAIGSETIVTLDPGNSYLEL